MFERFRARLRRRGVLGGVAGATAALAGCEVLDSDSGGESNEPDPTGDQSRGPATGGLHPPPADGFDVRGARHPAWLVSLCREEYTTSARSFEPVGNAPSYGFVPAPAGMVPLLRVIVALHNDTVGEHTAFRLTTPGRRERNLDPLVAMRTDGSSAVNRLYDEVYLNETRFGTSFKGSLGDATLEARLRVTGGTGTLRPTSTAALVYEVVDARGGAGVVEEAGGGS